jgi:hypothetical protein
MTILCTFLITAFYYIQRHDRLVIGGPTMDSRQKNSYSLRYLGNKWNLDVSTLFTILKIMWIKIGISKSMLGGFLWCTELYQTIIMKLFKETFRDNHKTAPVRVMNSLHQWKFCYIPGYNLLKYYITASTRSRFRHLAECVIKHV